MPVEKHITFPNGFKIPSIGLGTSSSTAEDVLEKVLETAFDAGYRHFDTAFIYKTEPTIGRVLQRWFQSGKAKRDDIFITTKLPNFGMHPNRVEFFLKKSLATLQLDYVDLYLVHHPKGVQYNEETGLAKVDDQGIVIPEENCDHIAIWRQMEAQVDAGRAKNIGLSNFSVTQMENILQVAHIKPAALQVEMHLFLQQNELREFCNRNQITIIAFAPLGSSDFNERQKRRLGPKAVFRSDIPDLLGNPTVNEIAQKYSKSPAQVLLRFLLEIGVVPIPKTSTSHRLWENIDVYNFSLDEGDLTRLKALDAGETARIYKF